MPGIDIELIAHGPAQTDILPVTCHVKKYTERFVYTSKIHNINTPIAYYESDPLDSWQNIQLVDQTHTIPENTLDLFISGLSWTKVVAGTFSTVYKGVAITHQAMVDEYGKEQPLFFRHQLKDGTVEANIEVVQAGEKHDVEKGFKIVLDEEAIYTNILNYYNEDTGAYKIYFITSVQEASDGTYTTSHELLNPEPAIPMASWEDVNLTTGKFDRLVYTREASSNGYTFTIEGAQESLASKACADDRRRREEGLSAFGYFFKPLEESRIRAILPSGKAPENPWHIKITNGEFTQVLQGKLRKYSIPEFKMQSFSPQSPYIYSPYRKLLWVNRNILKFTRNFTAVLPEKNMNIHIYVYNADKELVHAYTSDSSLDGERYSNTEIFYEADKILSYDNRSGFVALGVSLDPNYSYYASHYYEAKEYEYTSLTLNPLQNKFAVANMWVYYVIPDVGPQDKAVHTLGVDADGYVVYCSQNQGGTHPNLQLLNADGSYNSNTIIGMKYSSMTSTDNFKSLYCVPYTNSYQYYIIAEVVVMDIGDKADSLVFDVRRTGATIDPDSFTQAIRANPRILQSRLGYGPNGQTFPDNDVMLTRVPITVLEDYGGSLTRDEAKEALITNLPAGSHMSIVWDYLQPEISGTSLTTSQVDLTFTWEGKDLSYKVYKRSNPVGEWSLLTTLTTPDTPASLTYSDTNVTSETVYYYAVRVVEDGIELPFGNSLGVMVK